MTDRSWPPPVPDTTELDVGTAADPASRRARVRGGASILLVDDRPENLLALEAILEPLGHRLVRAESADEALRHVLRESFAVILLDVQMPGTDGLETARLIKQRTRSEHVPIIFITALDHDRRHATLGYESGAVDYLFKPLDPDLLRAKVAAFVELDRLREALAEQQSRRFADLAVQESEERYRLVQKATNDVIWDWNLVTNGLRWNELAATVFRAPPGALPDDVQWWIGHIHPDDRERVVTGVHRVIAGGDGAAWSVEYRFLLGDGSYRTFLDRGYAVRDATGRPIRMIGAMQDVTERVEAREAAEAASRLKSEFLATMSHEFRTPLNAIIGYAQLLDMGVFGPATAAQQAHLERMLASARHLLGLVDDVLDVAKVDADRLTVRRETHLIGAVIAAAVAIVQPQATAKGVRLVGHGAGKPEFAYVGDEHRVRQVLVNLISNAVKFTPAGGTVTIARGVTSEPGKDAGRSDPERASEGAGPQTWVYARVADTGPGIAPDMIGDVFEPFVQGNAALTREHGGTGLGLAISRRLARLMGGDITVRSDDGAGATFTLWLRGAEQADPSTTLPAMAPEPSDRAGQLAVDSTPRTAADALDAAAYAELYALSVRLVADIESIAERYVEALRTDGRFPGARALPSVQLRDHVTPLLGVLASQLMVIGETRGQAPELLGDGGRMQRVMAELHGAQRHRLGWSEAHIERETLLLFAEIEHAIRMGSADGASGRRPDHGAMAAPRAVPDAEQMAARFAMDVVRHMLEQVTRVALRAHRVARTADVP